MINVTLYSRQDCHLCEQARADLDALQAVVPHRLAVIDIDSHQRLQQEFGFEIPVVEAGPYRLKAPFGAQELQMTLMAAWDRERHIDRVEHSPALEQVRKSGGWTNADGFTLWISKHYLLFFNLFVILYLGGALMAPMLMMAGAEAPANLIYRAYSLVCHQLPYRSVFIFGEQWVYPRAAASVEGLKTFEQATGLSEGNDAAALFAARTFTGNQVVGYKIALCQRDLAIYAGILMFGLLFGLLGKRLPGVPWYLWLLAGIGPIGLDGLSQLISQPPISLLPYRETTPSLRFATGWLFGFFTAWFGYPMVEETMADTRQVMVDKWQRVRGLVDGG
ncbi:MAG: DUF2085 domain-containing protein [Anaerolineales bacterium]|nr:DUF2085 domain-containing protein [Anaerolineales bacterium]